MKKLKYWLRDWLGITALANDQNKNARGIRSVFDMVKEQEKDIILLKGLVDVGVDVHRYGESWAVVCIKGKADWVQFYDLGARDADEIRRFMRNFEGTNPKIDVYPSNMKRWFLS